MNDFAVFILSHGRAGNIKTLKALENGNYSGKWYIVIDNEDDQAEEYRKRFGNHVLQFDKLAIAQTFDTGDTEENRRTIVYARNACFMLARQVGVRYFLELDDDYTSFEYRWAEGKKLKVKKAKQLDRLFAGMIEFLKATGAVTVAFAQGGDYIGGASGMNARKPVLRKAMNTFFCDAENPFQFVGRINEDVNTYTKLGQEGKLMLTITAASIVQTQTQKAAGGMSGVYVDGGTYMKSFYSVMYSPSCVTISEMGDTHRRIHHHISWRNCTPCILNECYKKGGDSNGKRTKPTPLHQCPEP